MIIVPSNVQTAAAPPAASPTFDAAVSQAAAQAYSWTHTVGGTGAVLLYVFGYSAITSATCGGVAMTQLGNVNNRGTGITLFGLTGVSPGGKTISFSSNVNSWGVSVSYQNVSSFGTRVTANGNSVSITPAAGALVSVGRAKDGTNLTANPITPGTTRISTAVPGAANTTSAADLSGTGSSVTFTSTSAISAYWIAVPLIA